MNEYDNHCIEYKGLFCPRCAATHECVSLLPNGPVTDANISPLQSRGDIDCIDTIAPVNVEDSGLDLHAGEDVEWMATEVIISGAGKTRIVKRLDGDWITTSEILHEPTDSVSEVHDAILTVAESTPPSEQITPFAKHRQLENSE